MFTTPPPEHEQPSAVALALRLRVRHELRRVLSLSDAECQLAEGILLRAYKYHAQAKRGAEVPPNAAHAVADRLAALEELALKYMPLDVFADFVHALLPECFCPPLPKTDPPPLRPTKALPGSEAKIAVLRRRIQRGQPLCHPDDAKVDGSLFEAWTANGRDDVVDVRTLDAESFKRATRPSEKERTRWGR
jgi:hypothetical protein